MASADELRAKSDEEKILDKIKELNITPGNASTAESARQAQTAQANTQSDTAATTGGAAPASNT